MRLIAQVPNEQRENQIEWLSLEDDPLDTLGFYIFGHRSLDEPSEFDNWYQTKELALSEAERQFGVTIDCWIETA